MAASSGWRRTPIAPAWAREASASGPREVNGLPRGRRARKRAARSGVGQPPLTPWVTLSCADRLRAPFGCGVRSPARRWWAGTRQRSRALERRAGSAPLVGGAPWAGGGRLLTGFGGGLGGLCHVGGGEMQRESDLFGEHFTAVRRVPLRLSLSGPAGSTQFHRAGATRIRRSGRPSCPPEPDGDAPVRAGVRSQSTSQRFSASPVRELDQPQGPYSCPSRPGVEPVLDASGLEKRGFAHDRSKGDQWES